MAYEEEAQQAADQYSGSPYPAVIPQDQTNAADLVQQLNPQLLIEEVEHTLRGHFYDSKKEKWVLKYKAFANENGVSSIISTLRTAVNQNTTLSNLTDKEIASLIIDLGDELIGLMRLKYKEFEIEKANLRTIVALVLRMTYIAFKRSYEGGERNLIRATKHSIENIHVNPQYRPEAMQQRKSFLGFRM